MINIIRVAFIIVWVTLGVIIYAVPKSHAAAIPELTPDLCIICHQGPATAIDTDGGKHKTKVTCLDCHDGHPPRVRDNIPECSNCHEGTPHFELQQCRDCHTNPHTPLNIILADDLTAPCLTCHTAQITQLRDNPSRHTVLACTACHRSKHGQIPDCMDCHTPHSQEMTMNDCTSCHPVHMPLVISYAEDTPSRSCAACHEDVYNKLSANTAKHSQLQCAKCHRAKHKTIPKCQDCHGLPHPAALMAKFPVCLDCHGSPHNLIY